MTTPTAAASPTRPARLRSPRGGLTVGDRHYRGGVFLPESARPALEALARKAAKAAAEGPVVVGIAGHSYRIEPIAIAPAVGTVAYSLADLDRNRLHHVHRSTAGEVACDCGDYFYRRCGSGQPCKHGRRLVELGLIPATTPTILPPFAARRDGIAQREPIPAIAGNTPDRARWASRGASPVVVPQGHIDVGQAHIDPTMPKVNVALGHVYQSDRSAGRPPNVPQGGIQNLSVRQVIRRPGELIAVGDKPPQLPITRPRRPRFEPTRDDVAEAAAAFGW